MPDDLIQILKERAEIAKSLTREVPGHLSNPDLTLEQATQLYQALDQQAQTMERFLEILEDREADDNVLEAAEAIDNMFSDLAAAAAEKMMSLTPRREEDPAAAGVRHARVLAGLP